MSDPERQLIPLFHTGHESPESPRIDFFSFGGIREVSLFFIFSSGESGESAQFGWNRARIHYNKKNNTRTCCTKVKESITNQYRTCQMQLELGTY